MLCFSQITTLARGQKVWVRSCDDVIDTSHRFTDYDIVRAENACDDISVGEA